MSGSVRTTILLAALLALPALLASPAVSGEIQDAAARGAKLFTDASLGTNGKSCNSCHTQMGQGEAPLTGRSPFPKVFSMAKQVRTLDQTVQACIVNAIKGSPLAWDDPKLTDLVTYVDTLYQKR